MLTHTPSSCYRDFDVIGLKQISIVLWIVTIMLLPNFAPCTPCKTASPVKPWLIYNEYSQQYLRISNTSEVVADSDDKHTMFVVKLPAPSVEFLLYDPSVYKFICLKKDKRKLVGRTRLPKNLSLCSFREEAPSNSQVKYVIKKANFTMAFNKKGMQINSAKLGRRNWKVERFLVKSDDSWDCNKSTAAFCSRNNKKNKRHKRKEISDICMNYN